MFQRVRSDFYTVLYELYRFLSGAPEFYRVLLGFAASPAKTEPASVRVR